MRCQMMVFHDHFSGHAEQYARYRPTYPPELFDWLASICPRQERAWDCATGNGQAAVSLAARFRKVWATDASARQVSAAAPHPRVEYRIAPAEACGLADASVDLIVVAQALHWFDLDRFYAEVRRVARGGGLIAAWYYFAGRVPGEVGDVIRDFDAKVKNFWPPKARRAQRGYEHFPFPFERISAPPFEMQVRWNVESLCGYLATWSATRRYVAAIGTDPIPWLREQLKNVWPADPEVAVRWPLDMLVGRV